MKSYLPKLKSVGLAALALAVLAPTGVFAQAVTGIAATKHNLGTTSLAGNNSFAGTAELCVFCHTPHGGDTTASVPLWNRALNDPANYSTYSTTNSSSIDGAVATVGSVSIACLSCHDGTQAMDTVINQVGSGGFDPNGTRMGVDTDWTFSPNPRGIANLGVDLTNDHPIGIQYGGGGITPLGGTPTDPDFVDPDSQVINDTTVWWIDTEATPDGVRQKTDIQLYTRDTADSGVAGGPQPFVECGSCHDPHTENAVFLRVANTGSAVCLACHTK